MYIMPSDMRGARKAKEIYLNIINAAMNYHFNLSATIYLYAAE